MSKVRKCLEIMESRVPQPKGKDNRKRKKSVEKPVVTEAVEVEKPAKEEPPRKRKRGRPPKKQPEPVFEESDEESAVDDAAEEAPAEITPKPIVARSTSSKPKCAKKGPPVTDVIAKFEEQYHEMGKMYEEMGKTLALLKSTAEEAKSNQEESIRTEVREEFLAEMQKRISKK